MKTKNKRYWPIVYSIISVLIAFLLPLSVRSQTEEPGISIEANNSENEGLILTLSLDPANLNDQEADWFLVYTLDEVVAYFNLSTGQFEIGLAVTHQGPLASIPPTNLGPLTLAVGDYTFYFAIDLTPNGEVDTDSLLFSSASINISENSVDLGPPSCSNLAPGDFTCFTSGYSYLVHVPDTYDRSKAVGLIVDLHEAGGSLLLQKARTGFDSYADQNGYIVAYPESISVSWNSQSVRFDPSNREADIAFIRDMVANISSSASIDETEIIVTGHIVGGSMAHTLACSAADIFTAAIPVSYPLSGGATFDKIRQRCMPVRPISIVYFHGLGDALYNGGRYGDDIGARATNDLWAEIQNCDVGLINTQPTPTLLCETHINCDGGVSVTLCTESDGSHHLYDAVEGAGIPGIAFDLLQQFK